MQRTGRMMTVIRRATGLALAGIVFLIWKSWELKDEIKSII
jgi:hypothetical protein